MTHHTPLLAGAAGVLLATAVATAAPVAARAAPSTFLGPLHTLTKVASTVPGNGDLNPYGVAVVPRTLGRLHRGDVLVSNFNDHTNAQGTGTTIVAVSPAGGARPLRPGRRPRTAWVLPRRRRVHDRPGRDHLGLGCRRESPVSRRHGSDGPGRLPARPRRPRARAGDPQRSRHQRPLGHDPGRAPQPGGPVREQRAQRHRPRQRRGGPPRHGPARHPGTPGRPASAAAVHDRGRERVRRAQRPCGTGRSAPPAWGWGRATRSTSRTPWTTGCPPWRTPRTAPPAPGGAAR